MSAHFWMLNASLHKHKYPSRHINTLNIWIELNWMQYANASRDYYYDYYYCCSVLKWFKKAESLFFHHHNFFCVFIVSTYCDVRRSHEFNVFLSLLFILCFVESILPMHCWFDFLLWSFLMLLNSFRIDSKWRKKDAKHVPRWDLIGTS